MADRLKESAQITRRYLQGQTLEHFAASLGIEVTRQAVSNWKEAKRMPDTFTLIKVLNSEQATSDAIAWAEEIMSLYLERG